MSMNKLFISIVTVFAFVLLNMFSLVPHTSALPMTSHEMNGMEHEASSSANCATLCRTAVFNKEELLNPASDEKEDEPTTPYYSNFQTHRLISIDTNSKLYAAIVKPPPKVPIYTLHGLSRS